MKLVIFQLIARRYEKHSTIFTTNKNFGEWQDIFQDNTISAAILDRILHHSKVIKIVGESYRLKERGDLLAKKDSSSCTFFSMKNVQNLSVIDISRAYHEPILREFSKWAFLCVRPSFSEKCYLA